MGVRAACRTFFWGDAAYWRAVRDPSGGLEGDKNSDPLHPNNDPDQPKMKRDLNLFDLLMLGVAAIIGAGIFVLTGIAARDDAGPSIIVSYAISGVACLICALCYAEYATECTITGGSCVYVGRTFGKFASWICAVNVVMELVVSSAAVAKGFAPYFCRLINQPTNAAIIYVQGVDGETLAIDLVAMGLVVLVTILLLVGVREATAVNNFTTWTSVICIIVTIVAGFIKVEPSNWTQPDGFMPYGVKGIFNGASQVFFAYIGFEMIASAAEESRSPNRDVPIATVGSVSFCGVLYILMAMVITGLVPYTQIDAAAPFPVAFTQVGMNWVQYIVAVGALLSILNTVIAVQYSMSRTFVALGRFDLMPLFLSRVHPRTKVPVVSTVLCGVVSAVLATFVPLDTLSHLVSLGTLVAFAMVCLGIVWRRLYDPALDKPMMPVAVPVAIMTLSSLALGVTYQLQTHYGVWIACFGLWAISTAVLAFMPKAYVPAGYKVPLFPVLPSFGVLLCLLLIGTLGVQTWVQWAILVAAGLVLYVVWFAAMHMVGDKARRSSDMGGVDPLTSNSMTMGQQLYSSRE